MFTTCERLQRSPQLCVWQGRLCFQVGVRQGGANPEVGEGDEDDHAEGGEVDFPCTFAGTHFEVGGAEETLPCEAAARVARVVECLVAFQSGEEGWREGEWEGEEGGGWPVG